MQWCHLASTVERLCTAANVSEPVAEGGDAASSRITLGNPVEFLSERGGVRVVAV